MDDLERRWRDAFGRYAEFEAEREAQVARWEWASGRRYDPRPLYFERYALGRGRRLPAEPVQPSERSGAFLYGFDAQDRVVLARRFVFGMDYTQPALLIALRGLKSVLQWSDQFLWHSAAGTESVTYTEFEPRMPLAVSFLATDAGRPGAYESLEISVGPQIKPKTAQGVWQLIGSTGGPRRESEAYKHEDGRLIEVLLRVKHPMSPLAVYEQTLSYDGARLAEVVQRYADGTVQRPYQRVKRGESLAVLAKRVGARLAQAIPASISAARLSGRAYCLALIYQDRYAPPALAVGMERDRGRLLAQRNTESRHFVWIPVEPWVEVQDPDFQAEYDLFEQQVTKTEGWETARKMLRGVARKLAQRDWTGVLEVTPDFVVFAADYEVDDVAETIAASNSPRTVAALRNEGWL